MMPRNNATTSGSHPSDEEPSSHRGRSRRLPGDRADQDDVAEMPRTTHRRRSHSDTPTDSLSEADSENPEAPRGRSAERITRDAERLVSPSISPLAYRPRHRHPDGLAEDSEVASGRAQNRYGLDREFPWFGYLLIFDRSVN